MLNEIRYSVRNLLKTPSITVTIVVTLGICIAAAASVVSLINAYSQKLPVPDPNNLLGVYTSDDHGNFGRTSYPDYQDYKTDGGIFESLAADAAFGASMVDEGRTDWVWGAVVSGNFFDTLQIQPLLGRTFAADEQGPGAPRVAVLSYRLWQSRFGGAESVLGKVVKINNRDFTIIGVIPKSFYGVNAFFHPDMWLSIHHSDVVVPGGAQRLVTRDLRWLQIFGRLRPGIGLEQAAARFSVLAEQIEEAYPEAQSPRRIRVIVAPQMPPDSRDWYLPSSRMMLGAAGVLLLIGCFNVVNLMFSRGMARKQELATRLAVGASRSSLVRLLLIESFLLTLVAAALGLLSTHWTGKTIGAYFGPPISGAIGNAPPFDPDLRVYLYIALFILPITFIIGLYPALNASRSDLITVLRGGEDTAIQRRQRLLSVGEVMVVLQVAFSVALLTCTGLITASMLNILNTDTGYEIDDVVVASIRLPLDEYPTPEEGVRFYQHLVDAVKALPGTVNASVISIAPLSGYAGNEMITVPTMPDEEIEIDSAVVAPGYFETLGLEVVAGEVFTAHHTAQTAGVTVINQLMAKRIWPDEPNPLGQQIQIGETSYSVIGVVEDSKYLSLAEEPRSLAYFCLNQQYRPHLSLIARVAKDTESFFQPVRDEVRKVSVNAAVLYVASLRQYLEISIWEPRLRTDTLQVLGLIGVILSAVGIFSLMRYNVLRQLRDIGIRLSVGATQGNIFGWVVKRGMVLGGLGAVLGVPLALYASRFVSSFLYGIESFNIAITLLTVVLMCLVLLAAALLPARHAAKVNPLQVIRHS